MLPTPTDPLCLLIRQKNVRVKRINGLQVLNRQTDRQTDKKEQGQIAMCELKLLMFNYMKSTPLQKQKQKTNFITETSMHSIKACLFHMVHVKLTRQSAQTKRAKFNNAHSLSADTP